MIRIQNILDQLAQNHPEDDLDLVERAYIYSARVHEGQTRLSGEPYLSHPLEVAGLLAELKLDAVSVAAGLLHDTIEDTKTTKAELEETFGPQVAHIVEGVTKLSGLSFSSAQAQHAESMRKMILAMADDIRVILIKLCDRLHNMRTLGFQSENKQIKISQETLDIYAPIASRVGMYWMKTELEDIAFMYLHPREFEEISSQVARKKDDQHEYIEMVKKLIRQKMDEHHLDCEVLGRHKHFYGIYQKMMAQEIEFKDVYDIHGFRIIVETVPQCYEALGVMHSTWKPIVQRFKDFIGFPKANMYQSLHTTVIGPLGERIEIQIRTSEMDRVARDGIAAHWQYKEGGKFDNKSGEVFAWLRELVEEQKHVKDPDEFMETVRVELFPNEVYVFTPQGDVLTLPKGATPIDFAYAIHTEVGNHCSGAKVDGRMVSLRHELKTGQAVEIITSVNRKPSKDWLAFVKTAKARSRVRALIKAEERAQSLILGREICEKAFRKFNLSLNNHLKSKEMDDAMAGLGVENAEDLFANIGYGKVTPQQVLKYFVPKADLHPEEKESLVQKLKGAIRRPKSQSGILVKGMEDILVRFGKCCDPVPGENVVGYITRGQGVTVHRANCGHALSMAQERRIELEWAPETKDVYPVRLHVLCDDKIGVLADITAAVSEAKANILSASVATRADGRANCYFTVTVSDALHMQELVKAIKRFKTVIRVNRVEG